MTPRADGRKYVVLGGLKGRGQGFAAWSCQMGTEVLDPARLAPHPAAVPPLRFPRLAAVLGKLMACGYRLTGKARYDDFRLECIQDAHFIVLPSVFNPK